MGSNYLIKFLEEKEAPTITKKRHTYLTYYGLEQQDTYVLKEGVIKTSIILRDGREFNISYIKGPDIISLLKDEVSQYTSAPFNVRIESETATFFLSYSKSVILGICKPRFKITRLCKLVLS